MSRKYEVAQIERFIREVGHFGGIFRAQIQAVCTNSSGSVKLASSKTIEWRSTDASADQVEQKIRSLHRDLIKRLLADAWEPIGTDGEGFVITFKRPLREPITRRFGSARFFRPLNALMGEDERELELLPGTAPL